MSRTKTFFIHATKEQNFFEVEKENSDNRKSQKDFDWNQKQGVSASIFLLTFLSCIVLTIAQNATIENSAVFLTALFVFAFFLASAVLSLSYFWSISKADFIMNDNVHHTEYLWCQFYPHFQSS